MSRGRQSGNGIVSGTRAVFAEPQGNVVFELARSKLLGTTVEVSMDILERRLREWYSEHRIPARLGSLKNEDVTGRGKPPKLKAKAAQTRHFAGFAAALCRDFNSHSQHDELRLACAESLVDFYNLLEREPRNLSASSLSDLRTFGRRLVTSYAALHKTTPEGRWKMTPKIHLFQHLCDHQAAFWGNPRFFWTYCDEDMVGKMLEVSTSCHPSTMDEIFLYKYMLSQSLQS